MLKRSGKTQKPEWPSGYEPTWEGDQWIVKFSSQHDAQIALGYMRSCDKDMLYPPLDIAPYPGGGRTWYVGELHP